MSKDFDEIDQLFYNYFDNNKDVPYGVTKTIETALHDKQNISKLILIKKIIIILSSFVTIGGSIVFAKDIKNFIFNFFNNGAGIDTAIENGYIENPNMEYIESNNTELKINNLLMDDYNLSFSMVIKFQEDIKVDTINRVEIENLAITDNEKNILYCEDENEFNHYCKSNNLDYVYNNYNDNYINSGSNWYIKSKSVENNEIEIVYNIFGKNYPKSKELNFNFKNILIFDEENYENATRVVKGNWNTVLEIPPKFYNREANIYRVKSCSNQDVKVTEAVVYNTGMKIELKIQEEPVYLETDSEEVKKEKVDARMKQREKDIQNKDFSNIIIFGNNTYVETENGKKYYPSEGSSEDSGYSRPYTGDITYWQTFSLTKYDASNLLNVYIEYKQNIIKIELERI